MINFNSFMPVDIIFGKGCLVKNKERLTGYKKIFIVSYKIRNLYYNFLFDLYYYL